MRNILGRRIGELRVKMRLTQDQFGARYGVSGPAIFKFEKGYVKPSLDLWLRMARDCEIAERKAVLLWIKAKLPPEFQSFIDLSAAAVAESSVQYGQQARTNYAEIADPRELRQRLFTDPALPPSMRSLAEDDEFWALYQPTGEEVQRVIEQFGGYLEAQESLFRDAFRLIREFMQSGR